MVKITIYSFIITLLLYMMAGCTTPQPKIVYKTVDVPVQYTPKAPKITRPVLYITTLTDAQKNDIGEMSKAYVISGKQLMQYACLLEKIYNQYQVLASQNPTLTPSTPTVQTSTVTPDISTQISNMVKNVTLTQQDYNDCNKVGP